MCAVYPIPLSCEGEYMGQVEPFLNVRLEAHSGTIKDRTYAISPATCNKCGCKPCFDDSKGHFELRNGMVREILEAFYVNI